MDLGPKTRLIPSRFCVLHGDIDEKNALRNWDIQGKIEEHSPWILLKRFRNNSKLSEQCHSTAAWKITKKTSFFDLFLHSSRVNWGVGGKDGFR